VGSTRAYVQLPTPEFMVEELTKPWPMYLAKK